MLSRKKRIIGLVVIAVAAIGAYAYFVHWRDERAANGDIVLYGNIDIRDWDFNWQGEYWYQRWSSARENVLKHYKHDMKPKR